MPKIREYEQQTSASGAIDTRRATGEDFGFGAQLAQFGETVTNTAQYIENEYTKREMSTASVNMAKARQDWTENYTKRQGQAEAGDMTLAPAMQEEMNNYFAEMADGYSTDAAKNYVRQHGANMTGDFFARGLQHQQAQAGQKARADHGVLIDAYSKTAYADALQYESIKADVAFNIDNGVGPYAYLKNAPDREKLKADAISDVAWSAAQGWIRNPANRGFIAGNVSTAKESSGGDFNTLVAGVIKREGGFVADDAGAGNTKFGINKDANPDIDVANLTKEGAAAIYKERYWDKYDIGNLPANVAGIVFDGAVNHRSDFASQLSSAAKQGATPEQLIEMRRSEYARLASKNPERFARYSKGWEARLQEVGSDSAKASKQMAEPPKVIDMAMMPSWYHDMPVRAQDQFVREVMAAQKTEAAVADKALDRTIQDHEAEITLNGGILRSQKLSRQTFQDPFKWEKYNAMVEAGREMSSVANASEAEQAARLEQLKPKQDAGDLPGVYDFKARLYSNAVQFISKSNNARREDQMEHAMSSGFSKDNPIARIQSANADELVAALQKRDPQADAVSSANGMPYKAFSNNEAKFIRKSFDAMPVDGQVEWVTKVRGSLSPEKFRSVMSQIASGDGALLAAGAVASSQYGTATKDQDALFIITGRNMMAYDPEGKASKADALPERGKAYSLVADRVNGITGLSEERKDAYLDAVMAHYIGRMTSKDSFANLALSGNSNNIKEFQKSVDAIIPQSKIGSSKVLRPYGLGDQEFQDRIESHVSMRFGGKYRRGEYTIMSAPGGKYLAVIGGIPQGEAFDVAFSRESKGKIK